MRKAMVVALVLCAPMLVPAMVPAHPEGDLSTGLSSMWELVCGGPDAEACAVGKGSAGNLKTGKTEPAKSANLRLLTNVPKQAPTTGTNSDLAFWGKYAIGGNYDGINIWDVSDPSQPVSVARKHCPGSQNDVTVFRNLIISSTDSIRNTDSCVNNTPGDPTSADSWEGLRIFDWSNPANPVHIASVRTDCGSHTNTMVPDLANNRLIIYVSSYNPNASIPNCQPPHDKISVVEIPLDAPTQASVLSEPVLFPDGGSTTRTQGCHDITAYPAIGLAAGACMGEGILLDITKPAEPTKIATMVDPNFSFWHSATFSDDGDTVIFTDERGGGVAAECESTDLPIHGADAFYDISNRSAPQFLSYFKIPRAQTAQENCVSHNGSLIPSKDGRDLMVQAWYQGGTSVIDFTDRKNPREVAYFDRGPVDPTRLASGGHWSSYWYNGKIYGSEIARGFDVFQSTVGDRSLKQPYLNVQTQEPLR
jgi:LVIVD repeat